MLAGVLVCKASVGHYKKGHDKYETLKTQLIRNLSDSKSYRIHQLTKMFALDRYRGRTPLELLHDIQRYAYRRQDFGEALAYSLGESFTRDD